ncbi:MAG: GNAT family N-acetyltransferase [Propionibacteriaceae bacterium]|nr:GNAT family N-acetyltransferase [Propionibacteriaceae bacterium]
MPPTSTRLVLREMTADDLPDLASMLQDPQAMMAYEGPFTDAEVQAWLDRQLSNYARDGYGLWAVTLGGAMIGQCGITWQNIDGTRCPEIGYHIKRAYWRHGYAVEAAAACRDYAFDTLGMDEVFAQVRDTNIASMNVAIRVGMTIRSRFVKNYRGVGMPHYAFSVRKA